MRFFEWGDVLIVSNFAACISKIILSIIIIAEFKKWVKLSIFVTMPSIKQETMDTSTSSDHPENPYLNTNRIQLREFQLLNTSVPPSTHTPGKLKPHK